MPRYTKQTWRPGRTGGTPISATRLQHLEDGIEAIDLALDAVDGGGQSALDPRLSLVYIAQPDEDITLLDPPLPPNTMIWVIPT
jgi:hypothetical protein